MVWKTRAARAALSGGGVDGRSAGADVVEGSGWCGVEGVDCAGGALRTVRAMRCGQSGRRGADSEGGADSVVRNLKASRGRGQCWQMARTARMVQDGADAAWHGGCGWCKRRRRRWRGQFDVAGGRHPSRLQWSKDLTNATKAVSED